MAEGNEEDDTVQEVHDWKPADPNIPTVLITELHYGTSIDRESGKVNFLLQVRSVGGPMSGMSPHLAFRLPLAKKLYQRLGEMIAMAEAAARAKAEAKSGK